MGLYTELKRSYKRNYEENMKDLPDVVESVTIIDSVLNEWVDNDVDRSFKRDKWVPIYYTVKLGPDDTHLCKVINLLIERVTERLSGKYFIPEDSPYQSDGLFYCAIQRTQEKYITFTMLIFTPHDNTQCQIVEKVVESSRVKKTIVC